MPFECVEDPRRQLGTEVAGRSRHLDVQEAALSIVIMLRKHDGIWTANRIRAAGLLYARSFEHRDVQSQLSVRRNAGTEVHDDNGRGGLDD